MMLSRRPNTTSPHPGGWALSHHSSPKNTSFRCGHLDQTIARSGFSLLETLLAIAIFVGAVAILSRLLILGLENAELTDWQSRAWLVAENAWAEIESGVQDSSQSGPFPVDEMPGWQWTVRTEPTDVAYLYRITIRVEKVETGAGQGTAVELSRLYFDDTAVESEAGT